MVEKEPVPVAAEEAKQIPENEDPIDREHRLAVEALAAAESGDKPEDKPADVKTEIQADATEVPAAKEPEADHRVGGLKAGLKAERVARQQAELKLARMQGQMDVLLATRSPAGEATVEKTPQQLIQDIRSELAGLAAKFDAGEITAAQWETERQALGDREWEIKQQSLKPAPAPEIDVNDNPTVVEHEKQLAVDYPIITQITNQEDLDVLVPIAYREAAADGRPIKPGAIGTMQLRERVAQIATRLYGTQPAKPTVPVKPALSPAAVARENKIAAASTAPPDVSKMGSAGNAGEPSESEVLAKMESMNEDDRIKYLDSLPMLKKKLMAG